LLVLIFGSINSLSFTPPDDAFAADMDDMGGDSSGGDSNQDGDSGDSDKDNKGDDSSNKIPKDAPATTDALTAGGDSDNDDDNDDDSGDNRDNDDDDNNDNDPTIEDAPATTDAITAKKCPKGQEVTLFSASCQLVSESDSTKSAPSAPMGCPIVPEKLRAGNLLSDPGLRAHCTGEPVTITSTDGTDTIYDPDGTKSILTYAGSGDAKSPSQVEKYDADNKLTSSSKIDPSTGNKLQTIEYDPGTSKQISVTYYNPIDGKPVEKRELARQTIYDNTGKPQKILEFHTVWYGSDARQEVKKSTIYTPDGGRVETDNINGVETTYDKEGKVTKTVDSAK
jgi:hypothetical protein